VLGGLGLAAVVVAVHLKVKAVEAPHDQAILGLVAVVAAVHPKVKAAMAPHEQVRLEWHELASLSVWAQWVILLVSRNQLWLCRC